MNFSRRLTRRFDEELRFFRSWLGGPRHVGAVLPTSMTAARSMASVVNPGSGMPVLELGPGTGVITRAILARGLDPAHLVSVEFSPEFHARLKLDHPSINLILGDAFELEATLGEFGAWKFDCVISGIPLLNFPVEDRVRLVEDLLDRVPAGRPVVQFSYGLTSPVPARLADFEVSHHDYVVRNVPPARLWLYRRPG
ncbi:MAG: methyltransferase domain-containing protein [Hoeflea sp.]|uniref:phospholipid N-methyltransferase PmtA n=1 Tax=Hoeflea sp. TaxID=1940281 RepID=UPI0032ED0359